MLDFDHCTRGCIGRTVVFDTLPGRFKSPCLHLHKMYTSCSYSIIFKVHPMKKRAKVYGACFWTLIFFLFFADVQDPCETMDCRFGSYCSTSFDGRTAQCVCPDKCSMAPGEQHQGAPVCGSDGRNYQNECEMLKVSCREMRAIQVKFKGVCGEWDWFKTQISPEESCERETIELLLFVKEINSETFPHIRIIANYLHL